MYLNALYYYYDMAAFHLKKKQNNQHIDLDPSLDSVGFGETIFSHRV